MFGLFKKKEKVSHKEREWTPEEEAAFNDYFKVVMKSSDERGGIWSAVSKQVEYNCGPFVYDIDVVGEYERSFHIYRNCPGKIPKERPLEIEKAVVVTISGDVFGGRVSLNFTTYLGNWTKDEINKETYDMLVEFQRLRGEVAKVPKILY